MKLTEYSRAQIQQLVNDGVCSFQTLRDYDLLKQIENGEKITHAADSHRNFVHASQSHTEKVQLTFYVTAEYLIRSEISVHERRTHLH